MKKIISLVLSIAMILSVCSVAFSVDAFAEESEPEVNVAQADNLDEYAFFEGVSDILGSVNLGSIKIPQSTDEFGDMLVKYLYGVVDVLIDVIVKAINSVIPSVDFEDKDAYVNDQFYEGMDEYLSAPAEGAVWSLGYGSGSLQTGDELDGAHYVGGSLSFPQSKAATAIYDDQRVRCVALNDGSGRGTVVFAVIDGFGLSNTDVRGIREELASFAQENDIVGLNISVLHQHSCVDTFGMNGDLVKMILANPILNVANNTFGTDYELLDGRNDAFMENLYDVTANAVRLAVNSMKEGRLYYSATDISEYIREKREPDVVDRDLHRFRFVPSDGSRETWIINEPIHCVGNGAATTEVTGDYPYYMEQVINERANANMMLVLGAELAISSQYDPLNLPEGTSGIDGLKAFGTALGNIAVDMTETETEVAPLLNFTADEYYIPVTNQILLFAGKLGALSNTVVSLNENDTQTEILTEIGYLELGTDIAIALIPGELEAAIAFGGALGADESWSGEDFDYPSMQEIVGEDKKLIVFGLTNDQVGYILTDNDYRSILSGVNEEIVASGNKAGSSTITAFEALVEGIDR